MDLIIRPANGVQQDVKIPDLEQILDDAPDKVHYGTSRDFTPDELKPLAMDGFALVNEIIKLAYCEDILGGIVELTFLKTIPSITVSAYPVDMHRLPASLQCKYINGKIDTLPRFESIAGMVDFMSTTTAEDLKMHAEIVSGPVSELRFGMKCGNSFSLRRSLFRPDHPQGVKEDLWFDVGTRLLQKAAQKYNLSYWYTVYTTQKERHNTQSNR